jgi:hypothetical protein
MRIVLPMKVGWRSERHQSLPAVLRYHEARSASSTPAEARRLDLAITKNPVVMHGGPIELKSRLGRRRGPMPCGPQQQTPPPQAVGDSLDGTVMGLEQQLRSQAFTVTAPAPKAQFESLHMPTSLQRSAMVAAVW